MMIYTVSPVREQIVFERDADLDREKVLQVRNLRTEFSTEDGIVHAVNGISYDLHKGEALGIVGESGCGKSVSVLSIMRLLQEPPARILADEILFMGQDMMKLSQAELREIRGSQIAMVFQDPMTSLNPVLTIGFQMRESFQLHTHCTKAEANRQAVEHLKMVGIPEAERRMKDYPHQFSGGMRQRVMIAMGLACNPGLLIADEPTTALDVTIQAQIAELVRDLRKKIGMALIWITHDLGVVAGLAERVIVMYAGHIVEEALVDDLYENPQHPYTIALLGSLPRLDAEDRSVLEAIEGLPPDLHELLPGCPFYDRCSFRQTLCQEQRPELRLIAPGHRIACWIDLDSGKVHHD